MSINSLVEDFFIGVFPYCDPWTLARCCKVSKAWNSMASADCLWAHIIPKDYGTPNDFGVTKNFKEWINKNSVTSLNSLLTRVEQFLTRVSVSGQFICRFPFNNGRYSYFFDNYCIFWLEIGCGNVDPNNYIDHNKMQVDADKHNRYMECVTRNNVLKETCLFMKRLPVLEDEYFTLYSSSNDKLRKNKDSSKKNFYVKKISRLPRCGEQNIEEFEKANGKNKNNLEEKGRQARDKFDKAINDMLKSKVQQMGGDANWSDFPVQKQKDTEWCVIS